MAATGILDQIGNTPLVRLRRIPSEGAEIWVKLEYRNPTGSMKDRMALAMIEGAERDGLLEPAMTVRLAQEEGIFAGTSSGANVVGALRLAEGLPRGSVVVTLAVDSGFKYMTGPPFGV